MTRLFNEHEAPSPLGQTLEAETSEFMRKVLVDFLVDESDVSLRDVEALVCGTVSVLCAEARLRRAVNRRKSDREAKGAPLERGAE